MATTDLRGESARVIPFPAAFPRYIDPADKVAHAIIRNSLRAAIDEMVALLDALDGDADLEPEPVESDGHDDDASNTEWHLRDGNSRRSGKEPPVTLEDAEDDDADSGEDDRPHGDQFEDMEPEHRIVPVYGVDQTGDPLNPESPAWRLGIVCRDGIDSGF